MSEQLSATSQDSNTRLENLTLAAASIGVAAACGVIFRREPQLVGLAVGLAWGAGIWATYSLVRLRLRPWFPVYVQATLMVLVLFAPVFRIMAGGVNEAPEIFLVEALRNLCAVSAIFSYVPLRRRGTLFIATLLVMFAFTLDGALLVTLCAIAQIVVLAFWLSSNDQAGWHTAHASQTIRWKWDFVAACMVFLTLGFTTITIAYPGDLGNDGQSLLNYLRRGKNHRSGQDIAASYSFQEDTLSIAGDKVYGEDADEKSNSKKSGKKSGKDSEKEEEKKKGFSTQRQLPSGNVKFQDLFQVGGENVRHIPTSHFDQFDGTHWRPEGKSWATGMTAQITDTEGLLKMVNRHDLDLSHLKGDVNIESTKFLEQVKAMAMQSLSVQGETGKLMPQLKDIPADRMQALLNQGPMLGSEAGNLYTHYDIQAIAQDLKDDPELLWKFLSSAKSNASTNNSAVQLFEKWRAERTESVLPKEVAALVEQWTAGKKPGWEQVSAIVEGLRNHAEHDPTATVPPGESDSIVYFLTKSRRGPDYLFATSCVVILRSLGYPSRMIGGYYAKEEDRGWLSGEITVSEDDVHYWAQVQMAHNTWVDLEPTPGFEIPSPTEEEGASPKGFARYWAALWGEIGVRVVTSLVVVGLFGYLYRNALYAIWLHLLWQASFFRSPRRVVELTERLIRNRFFRAGIPLRRGQTFAQMAALYVPQNDEVHRFQQLAQQAIYRTRFDAPNGQTREELFQAAREAVKALRPRKIRSLIATPKTQLN